MYNIYVVFKCFDGKREAFVEKVKSEGILDAIKAEDGFGRYDYYFFVVGNKAFARLCNQY